MKLQTLLCMALLAMGSSASAEEWLHRAERTDCDLPHLVQQATELLGQPPAPPYNLQATVQHLGGPNGLVFPTLAKNECQ